jgi:hypothetical protein
MREKANMTILNASRAVTLGLAMALMLPMTTFPHGAARAAGVGNPHEPMLGSSIGDGDRAPHLYPTTLPGTLGCMDDAYSRVTWGCD